MKYTRKKLIQEFIKYYKSKNHKEIPNAPLIPQDDPTVLFTTAGMHPIVPYLLGQKHPQGKRLVNNQKCIRTTDIEEVGDATHHTFFEMLGKWSLGDYWKEDAIKYTFEFHNKILKIPKEKLSATCFKGDKDAPKDNESAEVWKNLGIKKIRFLGKQDNWWDSPGKTGPCGPDTELFYKDVEIGNDVLMEYNKTETGKFEKAKQQNIDFGGGVERLLAVLNNLDDNYLTEIWQPIIKEIEKLSQKKYNSNKSVKRSMRIIADHVKAAVMLMAENVSPGNIEQGYVVRRLLRRAIKYGKDLDMPNNFTSKLVSPILKIYPDYEHLKKNKKFILEELEKEEKKFEKTLEKGLNKLKKFVEGNKNICGKDAFLLYQSYGFPIEMVKEEVEKLNKKFPEKECQLEFKKHQKLSRTATEGRFKSGLADSSEATTKLHTATHLLLAALRKVLKDDSIIQRGSNITGERLRLDFSFPRKVEKNELDQVEKIVNDVIKKGCPVKRQEMSPAQAKKSGALGVFDTKYGEKVSVYSIENFSKEICAGPHVESLKGLGKFKIKKEESSSSGVRRIKATLS